MVQVTNISVSVYMFRLFCYNAAYKYHTECMGQVTPLMKQGKAAVII